MAPSQTDLRCIRQTQEHLADHKKHQLDHNLGIITPIAPAFKSELLENVSLFLLWKVIVETRVTSPEQAAYLSFDPLVDPTSGTQIQCIEG